MHHAPSRIGHARQIACLALPIALVAAVAAAACQAAPITTPPASETTSPPTPAPTPASEGSAAASVIPAIEVSGSRSALEPGRYTRQGFVPRITFELDGPWHSVNVLNGFFDVQQDVGSPDVIAVQFARPNQVYTAPDRPAAISGAQDAAAALQHNARLMVVETSSSLIAGLTGYQLTVENPTAMTGDAQVMQVPPGA